MNKVRRTIKWHDHITLKQLAHLRESGIFTLDSFRKTRKHQRISRHKADLENVPPGIGEPCWECKEIERRLEAAGINIKGEHP